MTFPRFRFLPTLRLAWLSVRSFFRAPLPLAALIALAVVPLLYSGLYLWSFWDPFGRMDNLPVALVNEDKPVTVEGEPLHAGRDITDELLKGGDLDWHLVDADEAAEGVSDSRYYVSLTIPEDFSANLASPSEEGATPVPARLEVHYNDANSYIVRELLGAAFKDIQTAAGKTATTDYLKRMFLGFNDIHAETVKAAHGAGELADGTDDAKDGSGKLYSGLGDAKDGSSDLATGLGDAKDGSSRLYNGLGDAEAGAGELSSGIGDLYQGSQDLAAGATTASDEVAAATDTLDTLADEWIPLLRKDAPAIGSTARAVATAATTLSHALDRLPAPCTKGAVRAAKVREQLQDYLDAHPDLQQSDPELYALLTEAREVADLAVELDNFVQNHRDEIATIKKNADKVATLASALAEAAPTLADDAEAARDKVDALDAALADIAQGSRDLRDGLKEANSGAKDLKAGIGRLHSGAGDLDEGIGELHSGAKDLDDGIGELHSGAGDLDAGIGELQDGAHELADGLDQGADEIPTFGAADRDQRGDMMSTPVRLSSTIDNKAPDYGTGFAPFFIALSLWVGAMVIYIVLPPLSARGLVSTAPSWRIALAGWLPALAIGAAQVALMMAVLHYLLGLEARNWPGVLGLLLLAAAAFTAIVHWLVTRFGAVGKGIALILLMLQLTSAGGTYPIETSPEFFQEISPYLPMSHVVEGLRHLISGGELTTVWEAVWVLAAYLVGALLLTWMSVERRRTWSMKDLHPPLKI
ncbi:YhgE/Pip domain-containing protein [Nocardiopsis gilva YIM 90087]|uniref:YhgE/Pip domain-containing protein n=1 Tax=Nocardiopsis gilva YIM 90087 TaxID=1235441 RepID=A0A223SB94_9ACTN|nr:YhgE/Pip domain-containing protein [Nocardiopsis gilva]ASU85380.1 YhgE/Pip domain-containing protein [Nocardiopsis gilva YIM 90087]